MEKFHSRILGILLSLALMFSLTPAAYAAGVRENIRAKDRSMPSILE